MADLQLILPRPFPRRKNTYICEANYAPHPSTHTVYFLWYDHSLTHLSIHLTIHVSIHSFTEYVPG